MIVAEIEGAFERGIAVVAEQRARACRPSRSTANRRSPSFEILVPDTVKKFSASSGADAQPEQQRSSVFQ